MSGVILFSLIPAAYATPSKQQQAQALKQEIDALDTSLEIATEDYNEAHSKYQGIVRESEKTQKKIDKIETQLVDVKGKLSGRAAAQYRQGQLSFLDVLLGAESFEDFASVWETLNQLNDADTQLVVEMKELKEQQVEAKAQLDAQRKEARKQLQIADSKKENIEGKLSERTQKLNSVNADIQAELAAIRQREADAAAARAAASSSRGGGSSFSNSYPKPSRHARSEVVAVARQYLGAPYRWGATGPNSFDCSGFTSFVYRQCGVSLPRVSRAQIGAGERVSRSDLEPGDLVFFGSPIHHVGIYVGGGNMIHAPRTGDVVKIAPLHSNYVGACRP